MNPAESTPTFTHPIESTGKEETFAKLSLDDVFCSILPAEAKRRKLELLANLKLAEATREEIAAELQQHDDDAEGAGMPDFIAMCDKPRGKLAVIKYAYDKATPAATGKLELNGSEAFEVLNKLLKPFGYEYELKKAEPTAPAEAPKVPDGPAPLQGYGSEGSGSENPTTAPLAYGK